MLVHKAMQALKIAMTMQAMSTLTAGGRQSGQRDCTLQRVLIDANHGSSCLQAPSRAPQDLQSIRDLCLVAAMCKDIQCMSCGARCTSMWQ